ncbi:MAG TPA: respiratory nitrate reductase subunit gamma [Cellvibrio sp.]|nr:respiratory nitrate reductase subunit gamma [Cellvibrio sp.]
MSNSLFFAFGVYPYIALAVCIIGTWARYDREQYTWKASSSQLLEKKQLRRGSLPFHVGILGILFGHFVGLLTPASVWHVFGITPAMKQVVAIVAGGLFGLLCLYGLVILVHRRLMHERVRASSSRMDIAVLLLLLAQLLLGLSSIFVSLGHLDGQEMLKLMAWAQNIVTFHGVAAAEAIQGVHWIFKAHVFLGMTLFIVFPFSRLVHILSVPLKYLNRNYQVVRRRGNA